MDTVVIPAAPHTASVNPVRLQHSVLNAIEKRTLIWLASRMPASVSSDHLTVLALVAMAGAGLSYWAARFTPAGLWLVIGCLAINWFGDSLDGTLARVRRQPRPRFGYYVDHVVDAMGTVFLFGGLAASGFMSAPVAAVLLIAYFLLCLEIYLATVSLGEFRMSFFGIGPTELRILLAVGNVALLVHPMVTIGGHAFKLFDVGGAVGIVGLLATFVFSAARNTRTLYRAEPLPATAGAAVTARARWMRFAAVGGLGVAVQLAAVGLLTDRWGVDYRWATVIGVLLAVTHNFAWHRRWTWRDRRAARGLVPTFAAFVAANGVVSLAGNVLIMQALVGTLHAPVVAANLVAIGTCAVANYLLADRAIFTAGSPRDERRLQGRAAGEA